MGAGDTQLVMLWKHGRFRVDEFPTGETFTIPADSELTRGVTFTVLPQLAGETFDVGFALRREVIRIGLTENPSRRRSEIYDRTVFQILRRRRLGASSSISGVTYLCKEWLKLNKYVANSLGFLCASTSNYILNRIWTFQNENPDITGQYLRFLGIAAVGLVINNATIYVLHGRFRLNFYLAKLFAIGVVTFWNFFMNYFFTF